MFGQSCDVLVINSLRSYYQTIMTYKKTQNQISPISPISPIPGYSSNNSNI